MYKLVGPVLVKQDQAEAKQNVNTRLEFIRGEMCVYLLFASSIPSTVPTSRRFRKRVEGQLKDLGEKSEKKKTEVRPSSRSAHSRPQLLSIISPSARRDPVCPPATATTCRMTTDGCYEAYLTHDRCFTDAVASEYFRKSIQLSAVGLAAPASTHDHRSPTLALGIKADLDRRLRVSWMSVLNKLLQCLISSKVCQMQLDVFNESPGSLEHPLNRSESESSVLPYIVECILSKHRHDAPSNPPNGRLNLYLPTRDVLTIVMIMLMELNTRRIERARIWPDNSDTAHFPDEGRQPIGAAPRAAKMTSTRRL